MDAKKLDINIQRAYQIVKIKAENDLEDTNKTAKQIIGLFMNLFQSHGHASF